MTAEHVLERAVRAAGALTSLGVGQGDTVGILLRNDVAFFEATLAAGIVGAAPVPINWRWKTDEITFVLADSKAKLLVAHADLLSRLGDSLTLDIPVRVVTTPPDIAAAYEASIDECVAPESSDWDTWVDAAAPWGEPPRLAPFAMMYTSGTTGRPKGVRRLAPQDPSDPRLVRAMEALLDGIGVEPGMRTVVTGPLYHSAPNGHALNSFRLGGFLVLMARFDAEELLRLVEEYRITHLHLVPTMFVRLLRLPDEIKRRYDLSSLQKVTHGAAPCPPDVKDSMIEWWGPIIHEYYGGTDGGLVAACTSEEWLAHRGTVGHLLPGATVRVLGADGLDMPTGEPGELYMRVEGLPDFTYEGLPAARREVERDGLITMGDIGYLDEVGYLYICDRKRDMVISGGVNIYPTEIEAVLLNMREVRDAAVFGVPDAEFGESLCAAIELEDGLAASADDIRAFVAEHLAGYKVPKLIEFHNALPREMSGKVFKRKLREPHWQSTGRAI